MSLRYDRSTISNYEKLPDGRLRVRATFSKVGPLDYLRADGTIQTEIVTPEELFRPDSLDTAGTAAVTLLHPPEGEVTPETWKKYAVGATGSKIEIRKDAGLVDVVFVIGDREAIDAVESRNVTQVSAGYRTKVEQRADGLFYQTDRIYNHLALVERGRAGSEVRLHFDAADDWAVMKDAIEIEIEEKPQANQQKQEVIADGGCNCSVKKDIAEERIDMATYKGMEMSDDAVAAFKKLETDMAEMKQKKDAALELQLNQTQAERDVALAKVDSLTQELSTRMDAAAVETAAQELAIAKQAAFDVALPFLAKDAKFDATLSPLDWKRKVLEAQGVKCDGKDDNYINAAADTVISLASRYRADEQQKQERNQQYRQTIDAAQVGGNRSGSSVVTEDEDFDEQMRKDMAEATAAYSWGTK